MKRSNKGRALISAMAVCALLAIALTVSAQLTRKPLSPKVTAITKLPIAQPPVNSATDYTLSGPETPYWGQKFEPLTVRVAEQQGLHPMLVTVTKSNGEPFAHLTDNGVVRVWAPYYKLIKTTRVAGEYVFTYGNDRVQSEVVADPKGHAMLIYLHLHRIDPDIPASATSERRPFLLTIDYRDPATGLVYRGETMLTLNGWVDPS